jgi:TatA/E family protein of Tat protein translocase
MLGPIGGPEFLLIAALALLLFGPRKLPEIGRNLGRALAEFRSATHDFKSSLEREVRLEQVEEVRADLDSTKHEITHVVHEASRPAVDDQKPES